MPATIPNLWPQNEVNVETLTPLAILRAQVPPLTQMTKGLLEADVYTQAGDKGEVNHIFDVVAPVLNNYRHRILVCGHKVDMVYPVYFNVDNVTFKGGSREAYTEAEFEAKLGQVLQSQSVIAVLSSLIARSNEARPAPAGEDDNAELE